MLAAHTHTHTNTAASHLSPFFFSAHTAALWEAASFTAYLSKIN